MSSERRGSWCQFQDVVPPGYPDIYHCRYQAESKTRLNPSAEQVCQENAVFLESSEWFLMIRVRVHQWIISYKKGLTLVQIITNLWTRYWKHTTERGSVDELLVLEEKQEGLDMFWESESRVEGGGEETAFFSVSSSLQNKIKWRVSKESINTKKTQSYITLSSFSHLCSFFICSTRLCFSLLRRLIWYSNSWTTSVCCYEVTTKISQLFATFTLLCLTVVSLVWPQRF